MTQTRPRRRPLTHQEKLALQERKQRRREKMEESRELAKGPIDLTFCLLVMLLTAIGLVILLSASFPSAYYEKAPSRHNPLYYFEKQGVFAVLGTAVMLLVSKFNYQRLRGAGRALIYVSVIFLILVIIPHRYYTHFLITSHKSLHQCIFCNTHILSLIYDQHCFTDFVGFHLPLIYHPGSFGNNVPNRFKVTYPPHEIKAIRMKCLYLDKVGSVTYQFHKSLFELRSGCS